MLLPLQGYLIDVKAANIIAGLEPDCTMMFLIALTEVASDSNIDNASAVVRCLRGEKLGTGPIPTKQVLQYILFAIINTIQCICNAECSYNYPVILSM